MTKPDARKMKLYLPIHPDSRRAKNLVERVFPGCLMIEVCSKNEEPTLYTYAVGTYVGLAAIEEFCNRD